MRLEFLGGAGTVTGSRYLLEHDGRRVLVDCGLFQGLKQLRLRNWESFPVGPASVDAVVLTHAHIDHSGYLPALARQGFRGPVFATEATRDLSALMLPDSGHLQEDVLYANRHRFSRHQPALPLYTEDDARRVLRLFKGKDYGQAFEPVPGVTVRDSTTAPRGPSSRPFAKRKAACASQCARRTCGLATLPCQAEWWRSTTAASRWPRSLQERPPRRRPA
jgi:metallo-beta-lactamase family protein